MYGHVSKRLRLQTSIHIWTILLCCNCHSRFFEPVQNSNNLTLHESWPTYNSLLPPCLYFLNLCISQHIISNSLPWLPLRFLQKFSHLPLYHFVLLCQTSPLQPLPLLTRPIKSAMTLKLWILNKHLPLIGALFQTLESSTVLHPSILSPKAQPHVE